MGNAKFLMAVNKLQEIDIKAICYIAENGSATAADIAKSMNKDNSNVYKRIKLLTDNDILSKDGYIYSLNEKWEDNLIAWKYTSME